MTVVQQLRTRCCALARANAPQLPPSESPPLSRSCVGVYGRVAHLADMRDKRYRLAVTAAMGKDFDGVVVKDGEPA